MGTDYTGCNEEIAESLKRGEHIKCLTKTAGKKETIVAYLKASSKPYLSDAGIHLSVAEPLKTETYVIDAVRMMKGLIEGGYEVTQNGHWIKDIHGIAVTPSAWQYCGKVKFSKYDWEDWMLEEREVE